MFFDLPYEIIRLIYDFDCTYKIQFDKVLEEIIRYKIYQDSSMYFIYDQYLQTLHCTDSLVNPKWICSRFHVTKNKMEETVQDKNLLRKKKDLLQYDIQNYEFNHDPFLEEMIE
jgi:hypothetical protein